MTWILIFITIAVGFGEYYCAHYFLQKIFHISDNKAHLLLGGMIIFILLLPQKLIWSAFVITLFFTPLVVWLSFRFGRSK